MVIHTVENLGRILDTREARQSKGTDDGDMTALDDAHDEDVARTQNGILKAIEATAAKIGSLTPRVEASAPMGIFAAALKDLAEATAAIRRD